MIIVRNNTYSISKMYLKYAMSAVWIYQKLVLQTICLSNVVECTALQVAKKTSNCPAKGCDIHNNLLKRPNICNYSLGIQQNNNETTMQPINITNPISKPIHYNINYIRR